MKKVFCAVLAMAMLVAMMVPAIAEGDKIILGSIGPLTGDTADYGKACLIGGQMYLDELNAAGGLLGKQVELISKDSKGDAAEAALAYSTLKNEGMVALFGAVLSGESAAVAELANADQMPMISPSGTAYNITDAGEYIFRGCFLDPFQAQMLAQYAVSSMGAKKVAVLYDNGNDYSIGLYQAFVDTAV